MLIFCSFQPKSPAQILATLERDQKDDLDCTIKELEEEHKYVFTSHFVESSVSNFCTNIFCLNISISEHFNRIQSL